MKLVLSYRKRYFANIDLSQNQNLSKKSTSDFYFRIGNIFLILISLIATGHGLSSYFSPKRIAL